MKYELIDLLSQGEGGGGTNGNASLTDKLPESTESSRFVSHRARMSGEFDSRKDSQSKNSN